MVRVEGKIYKTIIFFFLGFIFILSEAVLAINSDKLGSNNEFLEVQFYDSTNKQNKTGEKFFYRRLPPGVNVLTDLEYAKVDGLPLHLDLYMAEKTEGRPPLIVWVHGGGWVKGDKAMINRAIIGLTAKGYALASLNYRLNGFNSHPEQIHDIKGAVRWLRANAGKYGYDASRIGVGGGSAGGHLALLLGLSSNDRFLEGNVGGNLDQSSQVQAILDLYGPSSLQDYAAVDKRFSKNKNPKILHLANPLSYLSAGDPPLFIMHGDLDRVVPVSQSEILHEKYQREGLKSTLHVIDGAAHGGKKFSAAAQQTLMQNFFDKHIKNGTATGSVRSYIPVTGLTETESQKKLSVNDNSTTHEDASLQGFHWIVGPKTGLYGSKDKFKRLLKEIDQTLRDNPLISGVYIITHWNLVEAEQNKYDFERLDKVIDLVKDHSRYYKLAVAPGVYSPQWLYDRGALAFETVGSNPKRVDIYNKTVKIPLPWGPIYQSSYYRLMEKVSERYQKDKYFRAITVTAATFMSPEWHLPHSSSDRKQWNSLEDYVGNLEQAWKFGINRFATLFPNQVLIIEASSYPVGEKELGDNIIDYGVKKYPGRFAVQINQLSGNFDQVNRPTYSKLLDYRKRYGSDLIIGLQNLRGWTYPKIRKEQGSMEMTAFNYLQAEGEYWELWYGDGRSNETTLTLQCLIDLGKKLGLDKFQEKLATDRKYRPFDGCLY